MNYPLPSELTDPASTIRAQAETIADLQGVIFNWQQREMRHLLAALRMVQEFYRVAGADLTPMLSVCCVCGAPYGIKDGRGAIDLSHGYCPECRVGRDKTLKGE